MARFNDPAFAISDPGTTASASQRWNGGPATYLMSLTAAASSTVIALQYSKDDTLWFAVKDELGNVCSTSANGIAAESYFNCSSIPHGFVRIKASAGAGATTTGNAFVMPAKDKTDG